MGYVWVPDPPRTFNLGLRDRVTDHNSKTVTATLASDEALLQDRGTLVVDTGARAHEASLRAVCNYVLGKIGASLAPGTDDANVTAYWTLQNLALNPDLNVATALTPAGNAGPINVGGVGAVGGTELYWSAQAAGFTWVKVTKTSESIRSGQTITASAYLKTNTAGRTGLIRIEVYNTAGVLIQGVSSDAVTLPTGAWQRVSATWKVTNPDAVRYAVFLYGSATAAGQAFGGSNVTITEGAEAVPHFTGASTAPGYTYSWAGVANDSVSTRKAIEDRSPSLYEWKPGTSAWEFLAPLTSPAGLRLFCDELRVWRLVDPATYALPGHLVLAGFNLTDASDTISRRDPEVFATGVVVEYTWHDEFGTQVAYDSAGTPEKVVVIEYPRPYPGPGAAAAILARRNGSGRTQDVTGPAVWAVSPGITANISLPDTPTQAGKVALTSWNLDDTALMILGSRGLIDIPPGSWLATPPTEAWTDPPNPLTWAEWT